jgi:hypothetical protein
MNRKSRLKAVGKILAGVATVYLVCTAALYFAMNRPPEKFGAIMARAPMIAMIVLPFEPLWMHARRGSLDVGDDAPEISLPRVDGGGVATLSSEWRERPVALVFGSYT